MILANDFHYAFLQQAEATDSKYIKDFSAVQRDFYINRSKNMFLEIYSRQAENSSGVAEYLKDIIVRNKPLTSSKKDDYYEVLFPDNHYFTLSLAVEASKEDCPDTRDFLVRRLTSDKLPRALKNANIRRFWDFEETVSIQTSSGFNIYTEEGLTYDVSMDYIRKVQDIAAPEFEQTEKYILPSGQAISTNVNMDIDNIDLFHKIISGATLLTKRDRGQIQDFELQFKALINLDRI